MKQPQTFKNKQLDNVTKRLINEQIFKIQTNKQLQQQQAFKTNN